MSTQHSSQRIGSEPDGEYAPSRGPWRVVIVGGGIAGLAAAWYLQREAARQSIDLRYSVLERGRRWGGKVQTEQVSGSGETPFILEEGPDAFLTRKPWALALLRELGLEAHMQGVNRSHARTYALRAGQPVPLPEGLQLLAPTRLWPFVRSPLFSPWGKLRVGMDLVIPPRRDAADESLASFVTRRLGAEALDRVAEPMMAGVYNGEPARQSMLATFPQYPALERRYGSVIRGLRATARQAAGAPGAAVDALPAFVSFETGTHALIEALMTQLTGELRLGCAVERIERAPDGATGGTYRVLLANGEALPADAVIVATLAHDAAPLLREVAAESAALLGQLRHASIGAAYLAYRRADVPHPLDGFGVVIPSSEGRRIDGMTWTSSKWTGRAPADAALLRVFFGGPHTRAMMELGDEALLAVVREEVAAILGAQADPLLNRVYRWPDGYPQYDVGHLERVAAVEAALPARIMVAGSSYRGVGVPDCVHQGQQAAGQVMAALSGAQAARQA